MAGIGFIGVGNMGAPMAANLVKGGHVVSAFDLSREAAAKAAEAGATLADTAVEAVTNADIVVTMLPAGAHVRAVYENEVLPAIGAGAVLIDCSTIDVDTARHVHALAAERGAPMLDAPVSGGIMGAHAGTLTFMCGGSEAAFNQARPFLDLMGKTVVHAGGAGAGQAAKICNNMMLGIQMISVCEAFNLADKLGLERQKLFDIASQASGQCWSLTTYCPVPGPVPTSPANNDYRPGFTAAMMLKDLRLAQEAAGSAGAETPLGARAEELYTRFVENGGGGVDFSGVIKALRDV
ncbi:MAG: 3-hydroxyisobutyrate dehydrogenase [Alphaproteobacteria bacterium]|nr:3-hydroxyisobutyrate dehydrogenase [Alphaproteobacteria bacterium]